MEVTAAQRTEEPAALPDPPRDPARRRRWWRIARNVAIGVVVTLFAIWLVLYVTKGRFLKGTFQSVAGKMLKRDVTVRGDFQLYFAPWNIKFLAEGLTVSNPAWASKPNLFEARRVDTRIAPLSLLFGTRRIRWIELDGGALDMEWNADHTTNTWTFSEKKGEPFQLPRIDRAAIRGTTVRFRDPRLQLTTDLGIDDIAALEKRIGNAVGLSGTGRYRTTPFRVEGRLLSPDATAAGGENKLTLRAWAGANVLNVDGTLPSLAELENVPLRVRARGRNLSELVAIIGVVLPNTRRYDLRGQLIKAGREYRFTRLTGRFGNSDLAGRATFANRERLHIDANLTTNSLDIVDAAPFIGYNPDIVAARGTMAAAAATGSGPAMLMPDAAFPVATMSRFDADVRWTAREVKSRRVPISNIDLTLDLKRGRLALSPLTFSMARGNVASDLIFDTRQRPSAVSYDIRLSPTPMGRLLAGYGVAEAGTTGTIRGRIQLAGRGDTIHDSLATSGGRIAFVMPAGTFWTRNVQLSELDIGTFIQKMFEDKLKEPVRINCGVIGFTVRNGVAAADPILIDTRQSVVLGRGGFSFKTEALDLAIRADSKKFSLFSGQSPVGIKGRFAAPAIDPISDELLGRAGVGLGLAIVATPVAGLLAFVDVGDAKAASCGPILSGARATAQRTRDGKPRDDVGRGRTAKAEDGKRSGAEKKDQRKKFLGIF